MVQVPWSSPLFWLTRGYAVLEGFAMPIIGEGEGVNENDGYIAQLKLNAEAAVAELQRRGVSDHRLAVGGHSYGAFMVANLLAHTDLFVAGIARNGAYNRTLTPFGCVPRDRLERCPTPSHLNMLSQEDDQYNCTAGGLCCPLTRSDSIPRTPDSFQSEERSFWEAPQTYLAMSPFVHADTIRAPLLLIHGEDDPNPGTYPMQSERMYAALKGVGGTARLVLLPKEGHFYRARESVMHTLWEQDAWLESHVRAAPPRAAVQADAPAEAPPPPRAKL